MFGVLVCSVDVDLAYPVVALLSREFGNYSQRLHAVTGNAGDLLQRAHLVASR